MKKIRTLALALAAMFAGDAQAETALGRFSATLPAQARADFAAYNSCALLTTLDKPQTILPFEQVEWAIAAACRKHIRDATEAMRRAGLAEEARTKAILEFGRLALEERRLRFEKQPVPGDTPSPLAECLNTRAAREAIKQCFVDQTRLLHESVEPAETIAIAVDAGCQTTKAAMFRQLMACGSIEGSAQVVDGYAARLRAEVISAIVKERLMRGQPHRP